MKIWSTMLYSELTSSEMTQGIANFKINRPTGSVAKGLLFSDMTFSILRTLLIK